MKPAGKRSASWKRGLALARASALLAVGVALASAVVLRKVGAQVDEAMLGLGSRVMSFPGEPVAESRSVNVNGVTFSLRTQVVETPLSEALRHYRGACASSHSDTSSYATIFASLAVRTGESDSDGYVACVDVGADGLGTLAQRVVRFSESGDLAALGSLRYAYLRRAEERPARETFVLTMWADKTVNLRKLLPTGDRDASGRDPVGVPRPPDAQRILSAKELLEPSGVFVYLVRHTSTTDLERHYREQLPKLGWVVVERNPGESVEVDGVRMLSVEAEHRLVTLLFYPGESGRTVVTILDSGTE